MAECQVLECKLEHRLGHRLECRLKRRLECRLVILPCFSGALSMKTMNPTQSLFDCQRTGLHWDQFMIIVGRIYDTNGTITRYSESSDSMHFESQDGLQVEDGFRARIRSLLETQASLAPAMESSSRRVLSSNDNVGPVGAATAPVSGQRRSTGGRSAGPGRASSGGRGRGGGRGAQSWRQHHDNGGTSRRRAASMGGAGMYICITTATVPIAPCTLPIIHIHHTYHTV